MNWEKVKLGDLYTVHNGLSKGREYFGRGYPFLSFSTVFNNYFLPDELPDLVQSTEKEQSSYDIKRGDVFVTRTSETSDELGMSSVALMDYPCATYNGFCKRMRPINVQRVCPEYMGYYLRMPSFRNGFQAFSTMTTRASLKNEDLLGMEVLLPEYKIQEKIASVLRKYDLLIENNQKQIKLLEEVARRLYREWFVDLHFPGYEEKKIVDGLPEGWKRMPVGELIGKVNRTEQIPASMYQIKGEIPVIDQSRDFIAGYTDNRAALIDLNKPVIVFGDHTRVLKLIQFPFAKGADGTQLILSNNKKIPERLLYCSLINVDISNYHYARHFKYLKAEKILVPDEGIAAKFELIVTSIFGKVQMCRDTILRLSEARDRLLPKLMSGELEG